MKMPHVLNTLVLCVLTVTALHTAASAAEIKVGTEPPASWTSGNEVSEHGRPLILRVQKGDKITFTLDEDHGLVTIDGKEGNAEKTDLVITCAQTASKDTEDKAVLKEVDCKGTDTIFDPARGHAKEGTIHLEVKQNFHEDVWFWCTEHRGAMKGVIRMKP